jgi:hypothetical protein
MRVEGTCCEFQLMFWREKEENEILEVRGGPTMQLNLYGDEHKDMKWRDAVLRSIQSPAM